MVRISALGILLVAIAGGLAAETPASLSDSFPLGVYWPWERVEGNAKRCGLDKWAYVDRCLDDMRAHNVDSLWVVNLGIPDLPALAERVAKRKMKLVPALGELHYNIDWRRNNWKYLETESRRAIAAAGESPAVLAWALCDEPTRPILDEMEQFRTKFHEWGAKQPAVVVTMWGDTPAFAERAGFPAVCVDLYPFFAPGNPNGPNTPAISRAWYRNNCKVAVAAAVAKGKAPWIMPQSFHEVWGPWKYDEKGTAVIMPGGILHWRPPKPTEMRWQVWSAVASGMRGFFWFCYDAPPQDAPDAKPYEGPTFPKALAVKEATPLGFAGALIGPGLAETEQYRAAGEAFGALKPVIPLLTGAVPAPAPLGEAGAPGWMNTLYNAKLNRTFGVLVNDDPDKAQSLVVWPVKPGDLKDLRSGKVLKAQGGNVTIELGPGDGTILEAVAP